MPCSNCQLLPFHLCFSSFWSFSATSLSTLHRWHEHWPERAAFTSEHICLYFLMWLPQIQGSVGIPRLSKGPLWGWTLVLTRSLAPNLSTEPSLECYGPLCQRSRHVCPGIDKPVVIQAPWWENQVAKAFARRKWRFFPSFVIHHPGGGFQGPASRVFHMIHIEASGSPR